MAMTRKQMRAVKRLTAALDACHAAGLMGGVYEYSFRVWPIDSKPDPRDTGRHFFERIEEVGATAYSNMILDGGAGV